MFSNIWICWVRCSSNSSWWKDLYIIRTLIIYDLRNSEWLSRLICQYLWSIRAISCKPHRTLSINKLQGKILAESCFHARKKIKKKVYVEIYANIDWKHQNQWYWIYSFLWLSDLQRTRHWPLFVGILHVE